LVGNDAEFRILGPFEVLRGHSVVPLSGARKALVAALLLRSNEPVTIETLIDDLWGADAPPTAPRMIRNAVSQLRRQLPHGTLVTRPGGYELVVPPERVDAVRFERLAAAGRDALAGGDPVEALACLREALELWHGRPLADFAYSQFAHGAIARLEELRVSALEDRIEAELQLGREADLVGDLEALVREQPLRERPRSQLMLALYRSGRQAEALAAYQQARKLLADELGLEPSPELRSLEQAILRHDPALKPERPAARPQQQRRPLAETRREVVVVSVLLGPAADVVDAEARRAVLREAGDAAAAVLERHGAVVEQTHTGALMGVFGVPAVHEDDSLRALRAAEELRSGGDHTGTSVHVGIDSGAAIVHETDDGRLAVDGEVVSSAARLALAARPAEALIGPGAERLVRGAARLEAEGAAWRLVQIVPGAPAILRRFDTELVGRERELDALRVHFERCVSEGATQLFTALGAPGIGKSKLAREFAVAIAAEARVLQGQCLPYGDGVTFWPLREIIREALGDDGAAAIESVFGNTTADAVAAGRVAAAIGTGDAVAGSREETFRAVRGMLETLAKEQPLVLVLEDVHWAEPTFLDLVDHVVDLARAVPIFVLCLARPELLERRPLWAGGRPHVASILLEPLDERDADRLIDNLLVGRPLDPVVRARVVETAEGNALFLEQMLALLAEEGHTASVPPTLQALLASRVDRLPLGERSLLERAAIVGRSFSIEAVRDLAPDGERAETELVLEQLVRRGLVQPDRSAHEDLRFVHGLIRDVVYESIPKRARAALHERCAERLDSDELVGHHLEQAHRYRTELGVESSALAVRAAERLARAGRNAYLLGDAPAAAGLLGRAVALVEPRAAERPALLAELADALRESGDLERASAVVGELEAVAESRRDRVIEALALVCRHRLLLMTSPFDVERLEQEAIAATEVFENEDDDRLLAKVWELRAVEAWFRCRAGTAEHALARAIEYAQRAGDERTEAQSMALSIGAAVFGPLPVEQGILRCEAILARPQARRRIIAAALRASAALVAMQGDFETARQRLAMARELLDDLGLVLAAAQATETAGTIELLAGDPEAAEAQLRSGHQTLNRMGDASLSVNLAALLAQALSAQGRHAEALVLTEVAELTASPGDLSAQVHWQSSRARALVGLGRVQDAVQFGSRAVELADRTDFLNVRADALLAFALTVPVQSDAVAAVTAAVQLYERKGNVVSAEAARSIASSAESWSATR
jgi:DNA-binding SARP family transcriptional activator